MSHIVKIFEYRLTIDNMHQPDLYIVQGDRIRLEVEENQVDRHEYLYKLTDKFICAEVTLGKHQQIIKKRHVYAPWFFENFSNGEYTYYACRELVRNARKAFHTTKLGHDHGETPFQVKLFHRHIESPARHIERSESARS